MVCHLPIRIESIPEGKHAGIGRFGLAGLYRGREQAQEDQTQQQEVKRPGKVMHWILLKGI
jgi:hypothetical protein